MTIIPDITSTPIPPYVPTLPPYTNITPFTYRDGVTFLEKMESFQTYVNSVYQLINDNFDNMDQEFIDEINALIQQVNDALAAQDAEVDQKITDLTAYVDQAVADMIAGGINTSDPVMYGVLNNPASQSAVLVQGWDATTLTSAKAYTDQKVGSKDLRVNVRDYGAKGDGVADDTVSIQNAINYAQSLVFGSNLALGTGAVVYLPRGLYRITATLLVTLSNIVIAGESQASTVITAASPNFDMVSFKNDAATIYNAGITHIRITATGNATAGYQLRCERCTYFLCHDVLFGGWFGGLVISGCGVSMFSHLIFSEEYRTTGLNSYAILLDTVPNYSSDIHFTDIQIAETVASSGTSSVYIASVDGLYIENLHMHGEFQINPTLNLRSVTFVNCYFDASLDAGVLLTGAPTNAYDDIRFISCYFRGCVSGVKIAGTVQINNVIFDACRFSGNSADGIQMLSSCTLNGLIISNCVFMDNNSSNGSNLGDISIAGVAVSNITIANSMFIRGGNPGVAIGLSTTPQNVILANLNFTQSTVQFKLSVGVGATVFYKGLLGYKVRGNGQIQTTTATTLTVNHLMNVTPLLQNIYLTAAGQVPVYWISSITSSQFIITFASAPTAGIFIGWFIDMEY